ncbi:hypothetical protein [Pseudoteredinibacter isoporae]|uniref:hypothetical protein n=1 Tax=Pseudoteredinibacter isoporae TaxID=570281 RepID=UPI003102EC91
MPNKSTSSSATHLTNNTPHAQQLRYRKEIGFISSLLLLLTLFILLLAFSIQSRAQAVINIGGHDFESLAWPADVGFVSSVSGSWTGNGGGSISLNAEFFARGSSGTISFTDPIFANSGMSLNNVDQFRTNMGQHNSKETLPADQQTINNRYTVSAGNLPTELYFLLGADDNNGHKFTTHTWSSSQTNTRFELIQGTPTIRDINGNNSGTLNYKNYDISGTGNNSAKILLKVSNPSGISQFESLSNRIANDGTPFDYPPGGNSADLSGATMLVRVSAASTPPSGDSHAVPTMNPFVLVLLSLGFLTFAQRMKFRKTV